MFFQTDRPPCQQVQKYSGNSFWPTTAHFSPSAIAIGFSVNSNSSNRLTLGYSGAGITTDGVTGSATLDSVAMVADVTNNIFSITSGDATGLKVQYSGLGANASVYYGESSVDRLTFYIDDILSSSNSLISDRLTRLNKDLVSQNTMLSDLDTQYESIRDRYMVQFTAMEQAVTSLKSTGDYLTNLFKAMNKDD